MLDQTATGGEAIHDHPRPRRAARARLARLDRSRRGAVLAPSPWHGDAARARSTSTSDPVVATATRWLLADGDRYLTGGHVSRGHAARPARVHLGEPRRRGRGDAESSPFELAEHGVAGERTHLTFHLDGIAGAPGDDNVHDGWSEALDLFAERLGAAEAR